MYVYVYYSPTFINSDFFALNFFLCGTVLSLHLQASHLQRSRDNSRKSWQKTDRTVLERFL